MSDLPLLSILTIPLCHPWRSTLLDDLKGPCVDDAQSPEHPPVSSSSTGTASSTARADQVLAPSILTSSQEAYQAGRLQGADRRPVLVIHGWVLDSYAARDPGGNDQAAKQRHCSEISTGSQGDPPSPIASQQGMGSPDGRCLIERDDGQRLRWSGPVWSPPPESNRRPHPYHGTTGNRCADRHLRRSPPTVRVKVIGSPSAKGCVHFAAAHRRRAEVCPPTNSATTSPRSNPLHDSSEELPWLTLQ
jgi:hypothetical protein